jgi:hypothetical protein
MSLIEEKREIARQVREAITQVPPLEGTTLEVDEKGIYSSIVGDKRWWRVPLIPRPYPRRLFPLYEVMAEIEEQLRDLNSDDILLFAGDFTQTTPAEPVIGSIKK